jgi:hypothetical protein
MSLLLLFSGNPPTGNNGSLDETLGALTLSAAGAVIVSGTISKTLGPLTLSGTGAITISGDLAETLGALTLAATGTTSGAVTGSLDETLGVLQLTAGGTVGNPPHFGIDTYPSMAGFQDFLMNVVGVPSNDMPQQFWIQGAFNFALDQVNLALSIDGLAYTFAVYNLGASILVNYAMDQPGQTFFIDLRKSLNIAGFVPGVILSGADVSTSESLVVPEFFKWLTMQDLQTLKDPWGRTYIGIAQQYGPTIIGLT